MLKLFAPLGLAVSILSGAIEVNAAGVDMDLMQTIEEINDNLASNIALENAEASLSDARELADLFVIVEEHYVKEPDAADAITISRDSRNLTAAIVDALGARNFESAANSATDLSRACRACHTFYRED
jgi:hypothetical protein